MISAYYIKLINDSLCHVGLVYVSNDGNVGKKFRKSKLPHICGHQREVDNILQQFLQPIECRITIRRLGFGQINSNLQFVNQAEKLHSVSIKSFPDFISIFAFVQNDIRLAQIAISDFLGLNMISSRYLDHAVDHQVNIDIPLGWNSETLLSAVKRCTTEWNSISKPFLSTKYNVLNIDKIQNKHIWFKFLQTRDRFLALQQDPNEISVYHGTGGTEPSLIYTGTEGLDFRFAREGYWGRGNYFAESILLADHFSYQIPRSNFRQILLFKVIAGKVVDLPMDNTLTMPPLLHSQDAQFENERYTTVTAMHPSGYGRLYVLYTNQGIYPEYVITYAGSL